MARKGVMVATFLTALILPLFLPTALLSPAFGAKSGTAAKSPGKTTLAKAPVVYVSFVMTVKGKGGSTRGETTTTWSVDRTYSGFATLDKRTTAMVPGVPQTKSDMPAIRCRRRF
jgi:hypothetical protein